MAVDASQHEVGPGPREEVRLDAAAVLAGRAAGGAWRDVQAGAGAVRLVGRHHAQGVAAGGALVGGSARIAVARMVCEMIGGTADALGGSFAAAAATSWPERALRHRTVAGAVDVWAMPWSNALVADHDDDMHLRATGRWRPPLRSWCEDDDHGGIQFTYVAGSNVTEAPVEPRTSEVDALAPFDVHEVGTRILGQDARGHVRSSVLRAYGLAVDEQVLAGGHARRAGGDFVRERIPKITAAPRLHLSVVEQVDAGDPSAAGSPAEPLNERTAPAIADGIRHATAASATAPALCAEELPAGLQGQECCPAARRRSSCGRLTAPCCGWDGCTPAPAVDRCQRRRGASPASPYAVNWPGSPSSSVVVALENAGALSEEVPWKEGTSMPRQTSLDLRAERLRALWQRLPERCRAETVVLWTQLIIRAARRSAGKKGARE